MDSFDDGITILSIILTCKLYTKKQSRDVQEAPQLSFFRDEMEHVAQAWQTRSRDFVSTAISFELWYATNKENVNGYLKGFIFSWLTFVSSQSYSEVGVRLWSVCDVHFDICQCFFIASEIEIQSC